MNNLLLLIAAVVVFCYFGGNNCPSVLKKNKEMLLGVLVGLLLHPYIKLTEGFADLDTTEGLLECFAAADNPNISSSMRTAKVRYCVDKYALLRDSTGGGAATTVTELAP